MSEPSKPKKPRQAEPPSPRAEPDVPPQVHEDETEWAEKVQREHVRQDNPELAEELEKLRKQVKGR